jgi:hypothetical protein
VFEMKCANCGAENPARLYFCERCAAMFKKRCARCGFENSPSARFCGKCSCALARDRQAGSSRVQPAPPIGDGVTPEPSGASQTFDGARKTVTALYAVLMGTTKLMEELDPEVAYAMIDPAFQLMIDALHRYDGGAHDGGRFYCAVWRTSGPQGPSAAAGSCGVRESLHKCFGFGINR